MNFLRLIFFILLSVCTEAALAETTLPKNLGKAERIRALEILGLGSSAKILGNPYPLGGYTGVEVGLSSEFIPIEDLASLGSKTTAKGEYNYNTLTLGKGLYYNLDTYVYFTPIGQNEDVQSMGAQIRWGFYEAKFFPLSLTAILHAGGANFSNLINVSTFGSDLVATVSMESVAIYFGIGQVRAIGKFIGGPDGITSNQQTLEEDLLEGHSIFGINIDISKMFVALQIDRYADSVYSGKLGFRF